MPSVVVAVPTYRRPEQLAAMLPDVLAQAAVLDGWDAQVLVVDNDPDGSAAGVVGVAARYVHEPAPGLAAVRNRALDEAEHADVLAFIDDDEIPGEGWLAALLATWEQWRCVAVTGPVRSEFASEPSDWIRGCGLFDRRSHPTGHEVTSMATNNVLLDLGAVRALGLRFDERFGRSGSEDTMFARAIRDYGEVIRWCDEAEVIEPVPAERARRRWVLRRAFRAGTTWSAIEIVRSPDGRRLITRIEMIGRALFRAGQAIGQLMVPGRSVRRRAAAEVLLAARIGMLLGALGYLHGEYRRSS